MIFSACACCTIGALIPLAGPTTSSPDRMAALAAELDRAQTDFDDGQRLQSTQPDQARQKYRSAAQRFSSVAAGGVLNGRLEFNLANAHFQAGDLGQAILHYRRAERFIPGDPMLVANLATARSRCLVQIAGTRGAEVLGSVLFWHYDTSESARARVGLVLYGLAFVLLAVRAFVPRPSLTVAGLVCGLIAAASGGSVLAGRWMERNAPAAVVTAMDVVVYKGPGPGYQRQFEQPLQPGVECEVVEKRGPWWRIELADGKSGWIETSQAELVTRTEERDSVLVTSPRP